MARWAVFDVDGTLLPGRTMERMFLPYAVRTGAIPVRNVLAYLAACLRARDHFETAKQNKTYLRGLPVAGFDAAVRSFFAARIGPLLAPAGLREIAERRRAGYRIMIMTGAPTVLAAGVGEIAEPDAVIATALEVDGACYTGSCTSPHPYGARKRELLEAACDALAVDFAASAVFANTASDALHMELFGEPIAVNPSRGLRRIAHERGWPIVRWR